MDERPEGTPGVVGAAIWLLVAQVVVVGAVLLGVQARSERVDAVAEPALSSGAVGVYLALLVVVAVGLGWGAVLVRRGRSAGRVGLWVVAGVLAVEPARQCLIALAERHADGNVVFLVLLGCAAAGTAAALLARPVVGAHVRAR
ncbi:hypothetical protein [Actinomadura atramentaria]|uniref:hypothetical protein n=1 Tax=Actinomadura atramentaria TaxID=1990 RepID=UPI00039DFB82|nr:hypothetical protein [Actinomadura atramentaria]